MEQFSLYGVKWVRMLFCCVLFGCICLPLSVSASCIKPSADAFPFTPIADPMFQPDTVAGDTLALDSAVRLNGWQRFQLKVDRMTQTRLYKMTYVAVPLIVAGVVLNDQRYHFNALRDSYIPTFRYHYDDYLQYGPMVLTYGLKLAGVPGRSSWGRMLVSNVFSAALMAGFVNTLKYSVKQPRPDGSGNNSFPSGHTATAFMAATILHKEYGLTHSPWYSIGGYMTATTIGVSRLMNNKHWISDVLVGAGIGILSTELGYYLTDLIYKDRGLRRPDRDDSHFNYDRTASFFGLYMGFNWAGKSMAYFNHAGIKVSAGAISGIEGAWFINRYIGIGGRATIASMPMAVSLQDNQMVDGEALMSRLERIEISSLKVSEVMAGAYFSYPLSKHWSVGSKLLCGTYSIRKNRVNAVLNPAQQESTLPVNLPVVQLSRGVTESQQLADGLEEGQTRQPLMEIGSSESFGFGTGLSFMYLVGRNLGVRLFYDISFSPVHFKAKEYNMDGSVQTSSIRDFNYSSTLGGSVCILFFGKDKKKTK